MVGSYHLDADDTTSATYEIANRAFNDAVLEVFGANIFQFNTKHAYLTGVDITSAEASNKPNNYWKYQHEAPVDINLFLGITDKDGYAITDYYLDFTGGTSSTQDKPFIYTNEQNIYLDYTFIPDLDEDVGTGETHGKDIRTTPAFLVRLVALYMAQAIAIELSGSENRQGILYSQYVQALRRARVLEGRSSPAQSYINDDNSRILNCYRGYGKV